MGGVAALWGSFAKRTPYGFFPSPAPSRGSTPLDGDTGGAIGLTVELYLGALGWTDISAFVLYRDSSQLVTNARGRPDEASAIQPQTSRLQINNRDKRFTPRNPTGPYYTYLTRNTPLRVSRLQNGVRRYRFHGEVPQWPTAADVSSTDIYINITAYGILRRLNQGTPPALSAMYRAFVKATAVPNLAAYWPCEDTVGAAAIGSAVSGGARMTFSATPTFAANSAFACSNPLPVVNSGIWNGAVSAVATWTDNSVRFLIQIPSGGDTDGAVVLRFQTTGGVASMELFYNTAGGGTLGYRGFNASGTQLWSTSGILSPSGAGWNGMAAMLSLDLVASGSSVLRQLQGVVVGSFVGGTDNGTLAATSVGPVTRVIVDPNANLVGTTIGHISAQTVWDDLNNIAPALFANNGDAATQRIQRLATEEALNLVTSPGYSLNNDATVMGNQTPATFLAMMQDSVKVDGGLLFEAADQLALVYRPLVTLYNQNTAYASTSHGLTLDYAQNQLSAQPVPRDDDFYTANDVTVQQVSGTSARAVQSSGALSIQPPPAGVGPYSTTLSLNTGSDATFAGQATTADYAGWRLHLGTVDEPRYPAVSINLRHPQFTGNLALMNAALSLDIGDVIQINNAPAWLPPDAPRMIVQGYSETMGTFEHDITFNCSPESPYRVAVFDDPVLSRADTDGSTLAAPLGTLLNFDGGFSTGVGSWTSNSCAVVQVGTSGSATPLPAGGPVGFGAMLTASGGSAVGIVQKAADFPVAGSQAYNVSALFYYPSAAHTVQLGIAWYLADGTSISTSSTFTAVTANTWTAISASLTAPSNAVLAAPELGLGGTPSAGDTLYATNIAVWQGAATVATTTATSPVWTTAAADFPFDIAAGGERMTVTNITGSSSPQTFTVARSVNGVAKSQTAGTDVRLWQPAILTW